MKAKLRPDRMLLITAKAMAERLMLHSEGTRLRIRIPRTAAATETRGWSAVIGYLGKGQPRLEIWFDLFTGYHERKFYAGFFAPARQKINAITKRVSRNLLPIRVVNYDDVSEGKYDVLTKRLRRSEFSVPILEKYPSGRTFYGIFDPTRATSERVNNHFCNRAIAFFEDVARALPRASAQDEQRDVYPRCEKRKLVAAHMRRERSGFLATKCKIRDKYKCQVCKFYFEKLYGKLGIEFAEAHHRVPLSQLRENIRTSIKDLATVCANCHRMLHHMAGKRDDIVKLRAIVRKHRVL